MHNPPGAGLDQDSRWMMQSTDSENIVTGHSKNTFTDYPNENLGGISQSYQYSRA